MRSSMGSPITEHADTPSPPGGQLASNKSVPESGREPAAALGEVDVVFVIGLPRAGTTLLSYLLAGGDDVLSISEPFLAHAIYPHWRLRWFFSRLHRAGNLKPVPVPRASDYERFLGFLTELARSNGLNDLGATYRIGLDATIFR